MIVLVQVSEDVHFLNECDLGHLAVDVTKVSKFSLNRLGPFVEG